MMASYDRYVEISRATVAQVREKDVDFLSAAIAFYAFFSLIPLSLLTFILLGLAGGEAFAERFILGIGELLTPTGRDIIRNILLQSSGRINATAFSLFFLLWAGLKLFRGMNVAFSQISGTARTMTLVEEVKEALTALSVVSIAVTITITAGAVISLFPGIELVGIIWTVAQFLGLTMIFLPLYHVFSDIDYTWHELLPGAVTAAFGWTVLQHVFRL
jgi:membrane protein